MSKFFTLLAVTLLSFSLCGMELIHIHDFMHVADSVEDKNASIIIQALTDKKPISEITHLLKTRKVNINYHIKMPGPGYNDIYTIPRCSIERCNPNSEDDVKFIESILEKVAMLKQQPSDDWEPYLFYAIKNALNNNMNLTIVDLLIRHGVNVNGHFARGTPILHWPLMCYGGNNSIKCIDYLLEKGADANACNSVGHSPLAILADRFASIVRICKTNKSKPNFTLFELAVEKLLDHGADIKKKQIIYHYETNSDVEKSNYDLLISLTPNLDSLINKVESKKKLPADFKKATEEKKHANQLLITNGREFNLHQGILSVRCPKLLTLDLYK